MTFQDCFDEYYTLYRGDSDIPADTDDEWKIAIKLANTAIRRWKRVDAIFWNELWTTLATGGSGGDDTIVSGTGDYATPDDFDWPGGVVTLSNPTTLAFVKLRVIEPADVQAETALSTFAWFTGNPNGSYTLHLQVEGGAPGANYDTWKIDYPYYKKPTLLASGEDGSTAPEMHDADFIVHDMLANRLRTSRNWPAYSTAKKDADTALQNMIVRNGAGAPHNTSSMYGSSPGFGI